METQSAKKFTNKSGATSNMQTAAQQLEKNKANYLKLFTTQLKCQSPLNPMDSSAMYNNIAQLNMLEQHLEGNKLLGQINNTLQTQMFNTSYGTLVLEGMQDDVSAIKGNLLGTVIADSGLTMTNGTVRMPYSISKDNILEATIHVENEYGVSIFETKVDPSQGTNAFHWNGLDSNGNRVQDFGKVRYHVVLEDEEGGTSAAVTPLAMRDNRTEQLKAYRNTIEQMAKILHESGKTWVDSNA